MLFFGLLGFRPGQLFNKIIGFIINLMFLLNYILFVSIGTGYLITNDDGDFVLGKFYIGFVIVTMIKFTILMYIYSKKYNLIFLHEDITNTRKHNLSKTEVSFVIFTFLIVLASTIFVATSFSESVLGVFKDGYSYYFAFKTNGPVLQKAMSVLEILIYLIMTWISFLATGFMISVLAVVLRGEFNKCIEDLQDEINKTNTLSSEMVTETIERFKKLRSLAHKVDDTFFLVLSLNLSLALGILCTSIYSIYIGETPFHFMRLGISISLVSLFELLPSTAALHSKVRKMLHSSRLYLWFN